MPKPEIPEPVLDHVCSRQQSDQEPGDGANAVADAVPTTDTSQQLQKERVPLVSQSQDDGRQPAPDPDDQDSKALQSQLSSSDALASLVAAGTAPKKSGRPGRPLKKKRGPKPKQVPGSTAAPQDAQSVSDGDTRPNSQGTATGKSQRGRGRPPRDNNAPAEGGTSIPAPRQQPSRDIKMDEVEIVSIRDAAKDPSRSTGKQTSDVSNSRSYYSSSYSSARSAADKKDGKEQAERKAVEDVDVNFTASQLESVALSEPEQTKKSVSFNLNRDGPCPTHQSSIDPARLQRPSHSSEQDMMEVDAR